MHWFTLGWWQYLLASPSNAMTSDSWYWQVRVWLQAVGCRARGHPYGVVYYNPNGSEPDMTCTNCGDDLG